MRLSEFIRSQTEAILQEWESFAATLLPAAEGLSSRALRDHAADILEAVALDISAPQTDADQAEKSMGRAAKGPAADKTASQTHAILRQKGGFDINQMVAEYRALRASVLRLWTAKCQPDSINPDDVMRFNEAIDQGLAESVTLFHEQEKRSRDLFLGMLGHDLRSPAQAITLIARTFDRLSVDAKVSDAVASLRRCGESITALLNDLGDFNRTMLGDGIVLHRADADLAALFTTEVDLQRQAHPGARIELQVEGDVAGRWDAVRLQQVLRNLISNAIQHGTEGTPVTVKLKGSGSTVDFEVRNHGARIAASSYEEIFHPLRRGPSHDCQAPETRSLGLGLFIVREVVVGHGGKVEVRSADGETVFAVCLPRTPVG